MQSHQSDCFFLKVKDGILKVYMILRGNVIAENRARNERNIFVLFYLL